MDAKRNMAKGPQPGEGGTNPTEGLDLEIVIERARGHDAEAMGEIYHRYVRRIFGLCRYMLDSRESAEDATSEVFLKLQRSIESYDSSIPFPRWLLRVAGTTTSAPPNRPAPESDIPMTPASNMYTASACPCWSSPPSPSNTTYQGRRRAPSITILAASLGSSRKLFCHPTPLSIPRTLMRISSLDPHCPRVTFLTSSTALAHNATHFSRSPW